MTERATPQAFISSYAPRLRAYANSLLTPVIPQTTAQPPLSRTTKRGTIAINYAEDGYDDDDFDDGEGPRRPTGLRSRREDPNQTREAVADKLGKELTAPVEVQGIWRDWMGKPKLVRYRDASSNHIAFADTSTSRTDKQLCAQTALPLTLIPIRLDLDINPFTPAPALPLPSDHHVYHINPSLPAYKQAEQTLPFRLKDTFLWNLHETLITPDQFATILIHDLDLPHSTGLALEISKEIRTQLEQYAGVALHPLFHTTNHTNTNGTTTQTIQASNSREQSSTPQIARSNTPMANGATQTNGHASPSKDLTKSVTATARFISTVPSDSYDNPDDTYRCIITMNVHLQNRLFTDRFEWSLLHPPGSAERFAKQTCGDLSLSGEWVPAMTHAIYEAVLKLKKEACESGGLIAGNGEIDNAAVNGEAGWRFDDETLADEWSPRLEKLSKEELEKREGDRERQIRRLRRETARFSSTANMMGGMPTPGQGGGGYFEQPVDSAETPMGRGERSKKKRRFRSLSPLGREGTPGGRGTPGLAAAGYGGGGGLTDFERQSWRCSWCLVFGSAVWAVRDGPAGPRSLCNNCGLEYERDKRLPPWAKNLHYTDVPLATR